jgi:predicted ATPase
MRSHHSVVSLTPLDRAQVRQMVGEIAPRHALSGEVVEGVSERTGGVPLFVEEVTRLLIERGEAGGLQAIPPTLQQSLAARLDRLGEAREVAQIGAVLGRDFSYALLRALASPVGGVDEPAAHRAPVAAVDDRGLQSALDRLVDADLLLVQGARAQATYRFKHALIQDAAYESLLKSRRQALHRRAGEILRDKPESAAAEPEAIAHHFTEAGLDDLAIEWWGKAGDQALRRSAFQEAIAHLGKAIGMADKTAGGESQTTPTRRLELQADYGRAVMWSKGFGAAETEAAFARASDLSLQTESRAEQSTVYYAQWIRNFVRSEMNSARMIAESFLREAEAEGRRMEAAVAHRVLGSTLLFQGELALARSDIERALALHAPEQDMDARRVFGTDTRLVAATYLMLATWLLGDVEYARRVIEGTVRDAHASGHLATLIHVYFMKANLEVVRDDPTATLDAAESFLKYAKEHNVSLYVAWGQILSSWARGRLLDPQGGARELRQALAAYLEQGNRIFAQHYYGLIAELEAVTDRADSALASVDAGLALAQETGEHWADPFLFRLKGEILLKHNTPNHAPAEEAFQTAIAIAKQQGARSYGLRAALSLAKLYRSTGRPAEARAVLAPALEGFSPTPEMPEIAEALALMERLA